MLRAHPPPLLLPSMDDPFSRADPSATVAAPGTHPPTHEVPKPGKKKRKAKQIKNKSMRSCWTLSWMVKCVSYTLLFLPFPPISKDAPKLCRLLQAFRSFVSTENEQETLLRERERERERRIQKPLQYETPIAFGRSHTHTHTHSCRKENGFYATSVSFPVHPHV